MPGSSSSSIVELRPEDVCPAGGIHNFERKFTCGDCCCLLFCCPCYVLKEACCGWCNRNPDSDNFDGLGCRATGPKTCTKCKQTEKETKSTQALAQFRDYHARASLSGVPETQQPQQPQQYQQQQHNRGGLEEMRTVSPPPPYSPTPQMLVPAHVSTRHSRQPSGDQNSSQHGRHSRGPSRERRANE